MLSNDNLFLEKRENPRIGLEVEVSITTPQNCFKILGRMQDISHGGFKVKVDFPSNFKASFREGDEIHFETSEDFLQLRGRGGIKWTSADGDIAGVKFNEMSERSRSLLDKFLSFFDKLISPRPSPPTQYGNAQV